MRQMTKQCRVPGCERPAHGRSVRCDAHHTAHRRHGDALQVGVTVHELKPFRAAVEKLLKARPEWSGLSAAGDRWAAVVEECRTICFQYFEDGQAMNRHQARAALTVTKLADEVEMQELLVTVAAMHLYRETRPKRFVSDRGFSFQTIRRCRNLTLTSRGSWFDPASGKVKHVYGTPSEKQMLFLGEYLSRAFGGLGLALARAVLKEQDEAADVDRRTSQAIKEML